MKKILNNLVYIVLIPGLLLLGFMLYKLKQYTLMSILIVVLAMVPFFISFEKKNVRIEKIVLIAAFAAVSSLSRVIFNFVPFFSGFNPASAIIIVIGVVFGREVGFMVGALTALISNMMLSHGPWTPFQMFSWGIVGYLAGVLSFVLKKSKVSLIVYGIFGAVLYSLLMDVYTVLSYDNAFRLSRYITIIGISLPFTITYVSANILFLLLFSSVFIERLERIIKKYNLY